MKCNYHIRIPTALSTDLDYSHVHVGLVWHGHSIILQIVCTLYTARKTSGPRLIYEISERFGTDGFGISDLQVISLHVDLHGADNARNEIMFNS